MFEFWIGVLVTSVAAIVYHKLVMLFFIDGTLRIDKTNSEKDIYRLDVDNLDDMSKKKRIVLAVDAKAHLSQK